MLQQVESTAPTVRPWEFRAASNGLAALEPQGSNFRLERDQALFCEGEAANYCYKVLSGAVRVCKLMNDGRRQVSDFFMPGDLIGFDLSGQHNCTAEAIVECVVRRYPKPSIARLVAQDPHVAHQMLILAFDRLATAQTQLVVLGRKTAMERLASFLLGLATRGSERRPMQRIVLQMSRIDIADHLGLTVETVSRLFSRIKRAGAIDVPDAHSIVVRDWDTLEELSETPD